ncbi:MAG: RHS repeat protein [Pyrinomonadaceae bacterium]|nr:RHS repeat protein [Pyrinomonadaceae bacterium]
MTPTRAYTRLVVYACGGLFALSVSICPVIAQCSPPGAPTFSAAAGPGHRKVTITFGGVVAAELQQLVNGQWYNETWMYQDGTRTYEDYGHNYTATFRTRNWNTCGMSSGWVTASATTLDIGQPWLNVTPGPGNSVYVQTGRVVDVDSSLFWSSDGGATFAYHSTWNNQPPLIVGLVPNQTYFFYAQIDPGGDDGIRYTPIKGVRLSADQDYGICDLTIAPSQVGKPVNVINGNMFLEQTDFRLPGIGEEIAVNRSYNSLVQYAGMFGLGWSTKYDGSLTVIDSRNLRLASADGRAIYFARVGLSDPFSGITPGFPGSLIANGDGTYTLTFPDGRSKKFGTSGKLLWEKDRNGNQTTLNYDRNGIFTGVTDGFGRTLSISISNGLVSQISDSLGTIATYAYYPLTNLLKTVTYQDGSKYEFEYDSTSSPGKTLLKTVKDASNNILETHLYDSQGRATTSEIHGTHEKYTLDYSNSAFTSVTDGLGRVTKYHFDRTAARNVVKKIEGLCGCGGGGTESTEYFYDAELNLVKKVDALGRETLYTYDGNRNLVSLEEKIGSTSLGTETFTYNVFGQVLTHADRMNGVTINTYDANGNVLTTKDPLNNVTTLEYPATNNKGLPTQIKDARNNITKFRWFAGSGLLEEIEDPYGKKTNLTYDARGRTNTITNPLGHVTDYNYFDDTQRKVEMIYPNLDKITYKYDIRRLLESVTDERGKITNYEFDPQYRLKKITDPLGHAREFGYNSMSFMTSSKDGLGNITNYVPDDFDRLKEIEYPAPTVGAPRLKEKFEYDKVGRIKKTIDTANRDTVYTYDDTNRKITVTNAELESTELKYNARFQNIEVKDALNQVYTFTYDPLNRMLTQSRAGGTMSFEYDAVGNRTKRTDYMGRVTNYEYDFLNRLKKIKYGDPVTPGTPVPEATYNYDDISRLTSAINASGTVSFAYDNRNRVTSTTDVFNRVVAYEYERSSTVNQKRLKLDGSLYATYNFDNAERLVNIVNASDSTTITFGYYADDLPQTRTYPNGVSTSYLFDNMRRLTRLTDTGPSGTLFDRQYAYNAANQISQIVEPEQTRNFGYDNVNRLTGVTGSVFENYVFDDVGNRTSSHRSATYSYQPFNKLTATETATYSIDANGNTTLKSEGSNFWRYNWDYENRLTEAAARKQKVRYRYDALGRRVQRYTVGNAENTNFTYNGDDVLVDDNFGTLTKYVNGKGIDNKLRATTGSTPSYFLVDHLGSTNGLANSSGALTASNGYDSFGNPTNPAFPSRYQFTGREFDSFAKIQFSRARFYDPAIGRFISEDPIGFNGGDVNLYGYVNNRPLVLVDPDGRFGLCREVDGSIVPCPAPLATKLALRKLACAIEGYNPWITFEVGGGLQFGPFGGSDAIALGFNPLTQELAGQTRLMSGNGGALGILATAGFQIGVSLGPSASSLAPSTAAEIYGDASAFGGGSGSVTHDGAFGLGAGVGPVIGGGAGGGLRIGETSPLFSLNRNPCGCPK